MDDTSIVAVAGAIAVTAKPVAESGARLMENLLGKPFKVAGALLADEIYAFQCRNRVNVATKTEKLLKAKGVSPRVLPKGFLLSLFDAAGNVESDDVQDIFAQLLASAVEDDAAQHPSYIHIARQFAPHDAQFLRRILLVGGVYNHDPTSTHDANARSAEALTSFGIFERPAIIPADKLRLLSRMTGKAIPNGTHLFYPSAFGSLFCSAVLPAEYQVALKVYQDAQSNS